MTGTQLTVCLNPPNTDTDLVSPNPPSNSDTDPGSLDSPSDIDTDPGSINPPSNTDTNTASLNPPNADTDPGSLNPPNTSTNPVSHFLASVNILFQYALQNLSGSDMVGIMIRNEVNPQDKVIGFSFRWKDQISRDVIWSVFEKVSQSNSRFNALDKLIVEVHLVRMLVHSFPRGVL
jgi:hypothetical protein